MDSERSSSFRWFERIPKVELHLHLEGAIPHDALWQLVQKYGGDPSTPSREALAGRFAYRSFQEFIDVWCWKNTFLREYEDFELAAAAVAADLSRQNVAYAEAFYSPGDFVAAGLDPQRLTEAIRTGLRRCSGIEIQLVADLIRDHGPERARRMLAAVSEVRGLGVIGIGIGGSEDRFPPEAFAAVFRQARKLGFRTSVHAGEAAGPQSVWGALRALQPDRIGHATHAAEDAALVDTLAKRRIPLELCVQSNVRTGVIASVREHPARLYFERGIPMSINTDDPQMFGTSLAAEYAALESELGFSRGEAESLVLQGVATSWLPEERKAALLAQIRAEIAARKGSAV